MVPASSIGHLTMAAIPHCTWPCLECESHGSWESPVTSTDVAQPELHFGIMCQVVPVSDQQHDRQQRDDKACEEEQGDAQTQGDAQMPPLKAQLGHVWQPVSMLPVCLQALSSLRPASPLLHCLAVHPLHCFA